MNYFCPQCGEPAKRYAGATEQAEGMPVVCKTHGRVFVNTRTLPIWGLLTKPLITKERLKQSMVAERSRKWRANNPGAQLAAVNRYRAKNPEWAATIEKEMWRRTIADPERHERVKQANREWAAKNRESINRRRRENWAKKKEERSGN